MSNNVVGSVYEQIIDDVLTMSRVDFEENGVDEGVLDELKQGWQRKLTQFNVAQFPWDPKPELEATAGLGSPGSLGRAGASSPSSVDNSFSQPSMSQMSVSQGGLTLPSLPMPIFIHSTYTPEEGHGSKRRIKAEPGTEGPISLSGVPSMPTPAPPMPAFSSGQGVTDHAAARAAAMLSKEFGSAANASINALNTQQQQNRGHANGLSKSQVDGSADTEDVKNSGSAFEGVLLQQRRAGQLPVELGRIEIDNLLHEQMTRQAQRMEGGGLMLPLQKRVKREGKRRAIGATTLTDGAAAQTSRSITQFDGMEEDEDVKADILDDEDAINSDLDDPEDDREDDDDEDDVMGPIMLCVYDKVQRVKNKWKCTLKDGVLTVNGKEYVFHKATGEYEW
ncbi:transcription factor IIA subunit alpha [Sporothrix epigloea]|uniref:Transcription factor IIA subunit alpha n=1 Tax=Sporothrix epigloea TaxID=1892477 RepID=A0ABP0E4R2_9PEZI